MSQYETEIVRDPGTITTIVRVSDKDTGRFLTQNLPGILPDDHDTLPGVVAHLKNRLAEQEPHEPTDAEIQSATATELDRTLHRILTEGHKVITGRSKDGDAIVETVDPSAAVLNVIRARVKDLGVESPRVPGSAADDLARKAEGRGITFKGRAVPPLDVDSDDAATG